MASSKAMSTLLLLVLVLSLFWNLSPTHTSEGVENKSTTGTKEGGRVYLENSDVYISASPHTLLADGYVYLNVTSKAYGGKVDFCFAFDANYAYPTRLEVYDPRVEIVQHELNLSSYLNNPEYRLSCNSTAQQGNAVYGGSVHIDYDSAYIPDSQNATLQGSSTLSSDWKNIQTYQIDHGNLETGMFYWNETQETMWIDLLGNSCFNNQTFNFLGMKNWFLANATVQKGKEYYLRVWLTLIPALEKCTREFIVAIKPHEQSLQQAASTGSISCLDPWYDNSWGFRKSHLIYQTTGASLDYAIKIRVHRTTGTDNNEDVYIGTKCQEDFDDVRFVASGTYRLLDHWLESITNNTATFWVEMWEDLSWGNRSIDVYYNNSGAEATGSPQAVFPFYDDFNDYRETWSGGTVANGYIEFTGAIYADMRQVLQGNILLEGKYCFPETTTVRAGSFGVCKSDGSIVRFARPHKQWSKLAFDGDYSNGDPVIDTSSWGESFHYIGFKWNGSAQNAFTGFYDSLSANPSSGKSVGGDYLWKVFGSIDVAGWIARLDDVRVRRYTFPEPGPGLWGSEEGFGQSSSTDFPFAWQFRKSAVVSHSTGAGTNYTVPIKVSYGSGTDSGWNVFCGGNCRTDFGDVRFASGDGVTLLDYWVETQTESYAVFWVKVLEDLSSVDRMIYVYYGNSAAESASNCTRTFVFGDDFEGSSLDTGKWSFVQGSAGNGRYSVSDGLLGMTSLPFGVSHSVSLNSYVFASRVCLGEVTDHGCGWGADDYGLFCWRDTTDWACVYDNVPAYHDVGSNPTSFGIVEVRHSGSSVALYVNGVQQGSSYSNSYDLSGVWLGNLGYSGSSYSSDWYWDWVYVRKYVASEPAVGSWGQAESIGSWYDSNWHFRKGHIISPAAGAGTDYQVKIVGYYLNGTDTGENVYFGGKCKGGFGDVRFTKMDGTMLLPYWVETPVSDKVTFWVRLSDNLNQTCSIIYVYYGNGAANSAANGSATFDFFDDFTTNTGWYTSNSVISCGTLNLLAGATSVAYKDRSSFSSDDYVFQFRVATAANAGRWHAFPQWDNPYSEYPKFTVGDYQSPSLSATEFYTPSGSFSADFEPSPPEREDLGHALKVFSYNGFYFVRWDGRESDTVYDETPAEGNVVYFDTLNTNAAVQIDWVFLAKFCGSDPAHGDWGNEEGTGAGAASPAAFVIWGTQNYIDETYMGGDAEKVLSESACNEIYNDVASCGRFGYCSDYWGLDSQPNSVYDTVSYCGTNYANMWIFYKGHSIPTSCSVENCPNPIHRAIHDSEGYSYPIKDWCIHDSVSVGVHSFVFLWTCGYGRANETGGFYGNHTWGMMASWMNTTDLDPDAWNPDSNDTSGKCFISFDPYSAFFKMSTDYEEYKYSDFVTKFYEYLMGNSTIRQALNAAAVFAFGPTEDFENCPLNEGYSMPDPAQGGQPIDCYIRVWGDGGVRKPQ